MKSRTHQSKHVQRLLVIVDVIQQLLSKKFVAMNGNYIGGDTFKNLVGFQSYDTVNSKTVRANALQAEHCEVCAKGALLLGYIQHFNSVDGNSLYGCLSNGGIERHTQLTKLFSHNLLGEIEAAFEGDWYVSPSPSLDLEKTNSVLQWRREILTKIWGNPYLPQDRATDEYRRVSTELLLTIMHKLIDGNGTKLVI